MIFYKCNSPSCRNRSDDPMDIKLTGYFPNNAFSDYIGSKMPDLHFCSHGCFVKFMVYALSKEGTRCRS